MARGCFIGASAVAKSQLALNSGNIGKYFTIINSGYYFAWDGSGWRNTNHDGKDNTTAKTVFTAKADVEFSFDLSIQTTRYGVFNFIMAGRKFYYDGKANSADTPIVEHYAGKLLSGQSIELSYERKNVYHPDVITGDNDNCKMLNVLITVPGATKTAIARKVVKQSVGVSGVARMVTGGHEGISGVARRFFSGGTLASTLSLGQSVFLNVGGIRTEFMVVHQGNPKPSIYDESCTGTWIFAKQLYTKLCFHNQDTYGVAYVGSYIQKYLENTFLNLIDASQRQSLKQVKLPCYEFRTDGGNNDRFGADGFPCTVFLLSQAELGNTNSDGVASSLDISNGAKLDYFEYGFSYDYPTISACTKRILKYADGTTGPYWLRNIDVNYSNRGQSITSRWASYCGPASGGQPGSFGAMILTSGAGVAPAMVLKPGTVVNKNFNVQ